MVSFRPEPPLAVSMRGFSGPRAGLDALEKRKLTLLCRESNDCFYVFQPVAYGLRYGQLC
jgi:hypothetical protein